MASLSEAPATFDEVPEKFIDRLDHAWTPFLGKACFVEKCNPGTKEVKGETAVPPDDDVRF